MLETTLIALQDITLEKIFDDNGRKTLFSELPQIMQQVCALDYTYLCAIMSNSPFFPYVQSPTHKNFRQTRLSMANVALLACSHVYLNSGRIPSHQLDNFLFRKNNTSW